ncbi:MAG TPA: multifunctional CCA tRNA nucleotidyl transferase/2'3'-cyclic phosphodiesterase/2'nucleotidase/phosphatase [Gammaproteobacteria bacterium]|nr:multifunctional CCA tRNA nucleotidyl transferase/2'3'-cyclic phosphodiesterase/2'nucleotidase/phosphatase [Gammaproteobacteria bacterium]
MKIYLVGGAVRDELLGRPVQEKDWVVVGATPEQMLKRGFRKVGKDFPVFLHPETGEEYALARTERKVGRGYTGFQFDTSPAVSLEEDLIRRDLTINAIAKKPDGEFFDPYHGRADIENKWLRHVSPAFVEDPVRVLRVARFAARFFESGFRVAPETNALMTEMVHSGELDALVPERVWKEWEKSLTEKNPEKFFEVLSDCTALPQLFPTIVLSGKGVQALQRAVSLTSDPCIRLAVLLHDLTVLDIQELSDRYRLPGDYRELALLVAKYVGQYNTIDQEKNVIALFRDLDAFRREERMRQFVLACRIITQNDEAARTVETYFLAAKSVDVKKIAAVFKGKEIGEQLDRARQEAIEKIRKG